MTKDEIIAMAREAAAEHGHTFKKHPSVETVEFLTAFYALVADKAAAKEREACALVCDAKAKDGTLSNRRRCDADSMAMAIRARDFQ